LTEHVLDYIEDRAHARRDRWHTTEVGVLPEPIDLNEATIVSRYARCGIETRRRFIRTDVLVSVNGCFDTPSSVARDYLMLKYRHGPKWTGRQRDVIRAELFGHPLYVKPTKFVEGFYLDAVAAYWSGLVRFGWDVNYYPGKWVGLSDPPLDFPWQYDKLARNSLVSIGMSTKVTMWRPENGYRMETRPNPRPNSQLYCLISDVLNGMACDAIDAGAVYAFTDGYIAPDEPTMHRVAARIREWGFECRIKGAGRGEVTNLGSYRVGTYRSRGSLEAPSEYQSVKHLSYHNWLKDEVQWATDRAVWHGNIVRKDTYHDRFIPSGT